MAMDRPARFGVLIKEKKTDLSALLTEKSVRWKACVRGPLHGARTGAITSLFGARALLGRGGKTVSDPLHQGGGRLWRRRGLGTRWPDYHGNPALDLALWIGTGSLFRGVALKRRQALAHARSKSKVE